LHDWIADQLNLSDDLRSIPHGKGGMTVLQYRLHWARSYLKRVGAIENSERGIWTITDAGRHMTSEEISQVKKRVRMLLNVFASASYASLDSHASISRVDLAMAASMVSASSA
jgi:restriction system protein